MSCKYLGVQQSCEGIFSLEASPQLICQHFRAWSRQYKRRWVFNTDYQNPPLTMPSFVWALPRRTLHSQRRQSKTNSIAITSVPKSFFNPRTLEVLRNHFAIYGSINQWVPLPGFGRIIVVYYREEDAEEAKQKSDRVIAKADRCV